MKARNVIVTVELKTTLPIKEIKRVLYYYFSDIKQIQVNVIRDKKRNRKYGTSPVQDAYKDIMTINLLKKNMV